MKDIDGRKVDAGDFFTRDKVFCMVCGRGFITLKKHIAVSHQMTPKEYRRMFGIPANKPLMAEAYSEYRKKVSARMGLASKIVKSRRAALTPSPDGEREEGG